MPSPYPSNTTGISKSFIIVRRAPYLALESTLFKIIPSKVIYS
tara:strand:+ start:763 stop:891 length:129 start_codon:yes stop_codon:yes gene_type:complete